MNVQLTRVHDLVSSGDLIPTAQKRLDIFEPPRLQEILRQFHIYTSEGCAGGGEPSAFANEREATPESEIDPSQTRAHTYTHTHTYRL